jgi:hypothetical protein
MKKGKVAAIIITTAICVLTLTIGIPLAVKAYRESPKYSLLQIKKAIEENDVDLFEEYVDLESVISSAIDNAAAADLGKDSTDAASSLGIQLGSQLGQAMVPLMAKQIRDGIEKGTFKSESSNLNMDKFSFNNIDIEKEGKKVTAIVPIKNILPDCMSSIKLIFKVKDDKAVLRSLDVSQQIKDEADMKMYLNKFYNTDVEKVASSIDAQIVGTDEGIHGGINDEDYARWVDIKIAIKSPRNLSKIVLGLKTEENMEPSDFTINLNNISKSDEPKIYTSRLDYSSYIYYFSPNSSLTVDSLYDENNKVMVIDTTAYKRAEKDSTVTVGKILSVIESTYPDSRQFFDSQMKN